VLEDGLGGGGAKDDGDDAPGAPAALAGEKVGLERPPEEPGVISSLRNFPRSSWMFVSFMISPSAFRKRLPFGDGLQWRPGR
jgi:hypothetical protein